MKIIIKIAKFIKASEEILGIVTQKIFIFISLKEKIAVCLFPFEK